MAVLLAAAGSLLGAQACDRVAPFRSVPGRAHADGARDALPGRDAVGLRVDGAAVREGSAADLRERDGAAAGDAALRQWNVPVVGDSTINQANAKANYGSVQSLVVQRYATSEAMALIQFDLETNPGVEASNFARAEMKLCHQATAKTTHALYLVSTSWKERTVTWATRPKIVQTPLLSFTVDPSVRCPTIKLSASVFKLWTKGSYYGLAIRQPAVSGASSLYASREQAAKSLRPQMVVYYRR